MNEDIERQTDLEKHQQQQQTQQLQTEENESSEGNGTNASAITPATPDNPLSLQPFIDFEEIILKEKVGHGSYGTVYKAEWGELVVAVKEFNIEADAKAIETEVKQLSRVRHTNIIALYGISADQIIKYLIMEYAEGGSLHTFLHGHVKPYYTTAHAMSWARQCAEGVAYLHAMKPKPLIHRDLKPLNLLLTNKGRCIKICDFGTVADKATQMTNNKGSAAWMAPEVFEGSKYTEKCDIFSWSIILWEVLSRQQPFKEIDNTYQLLWTIHKGARPAVLNGCPDHIIKLMTDCWATKPEVRPSMQYVVDVMRQFTAGIKKADEPLEYVFENQQITITGSYAAIEGDNYKLDFCDFADNPLAAITPSNTQTSGNNLIGRYTEIPQASIITTSCWEAIPEESDLSDHTPTSDSNTIFNLTPSSESRQRIETIRNGMTQYASKPMAPLSIDTDPNAWDLNSNDSFAKSDGKERLTVTDAKPILTHSTTITNNNKNGSFETTSTTTSNNYLSDYDDGQDENDDGTGQSLVDMLDPEFQPEPPIPNNPESQAIYKDHQRLAKEFLGINEEIVYAHALKNNILSKMDPEERRRKEEYLRKLKEKEELLVLYNTLKSQALNQQNCSSAMGEDGVRQNQDFNGSHNSNDFLQDGWVFIPNNQDSPNV